MKYRYLGADHRQRWAFSLVERDSAEPQPGWRKEEETCKKLSPIGLRKHIVTETRGVNCRTFLCPPFNANAEIVSSLPRDNDNKPEQWLHTEIVPPGRSPWHCIRPSTGGPGPAGCTPATPAHSHPWKSHFLCPAGGETWKVSGVTDNSEGRKRAPSKGAGAGDEVMVPMMDQSEVGRHNRTAGPWILTRGEGVKEPLSWRNLCQERCKYDKSGKLYVSAG